MTSHFYTDLDGDKLYIRHFLNKLTGKAPPYNQFATPTVVLYRCHCGCDYCGVVSAEIIINENSMIWQNVGYENENFDKNNIDESELNDLDKWQLTRLNFTFNKDDYFKEIDRFYQSM